MIRKCKILAAASGSIYTKKYNKLPKNKKVTILGECGKYYYINCNNSKRGDKGKGFVLKKNVVYIKLRKRSSVIRKGGSNEITVNVYNDNYKNIKWSNTKGKVKFEKISHKRGKKNKYGCYVTRVEYKVYGRKEGVVNIKAKKKSASDRCFYSVYTPWDNVEGFINKKATLYKAASDDHGDRGKRKEKRKVTIKGRCTSKWLYVKVGKKYGFVRSYKVTYIIFFVIAFLILIFYIF